MENQEYQPQTGSEVTAFIYGLTHGEEVLAPRGSRLQEIADKEIPYLERIVTKN